MLNQAAKEHKADTIDSPLQETNDDYGGEINLVAALLDGNCFYFLFDQLFDPDLPPAKEDLLIKSDEQSYTVLDTQVISPIKEGSSWSALAVLVDKASPPQVAVNLRYNPSQWFMWSLTHEDSVGAFKVNTQLLSNQPLKKQLSFLKTEFDADALNQTKASLNTKNHQAKAFINLAVGRHIQITFNSELDMACLPKVEDFRAESDNHWLSISTVNLVKPNIGWPDLRIELAEELHPGDKVSVGYRSPSNKLKTVSGKAVENFTTSEVASARSRSEPGIQDQAHTANESPKARITISNPQERPQVSTTEAISVTDQGIADMLGLRLVKIAKTPARITKNTSPKRVLQKSNNTPKPSIKQRSPESTSNKARTKQKDELDLEISLDVTFIDSMTESEPDIQQKAKPVTSPERNALADTAQRQAISDDKPQVQPTQTPTHDNVTKSKAAPPTEVSKKVSSEAPPQEHANPTTTQAEGALSTEKQGNNDVLASGDAVKNKAPSIEASEINRLKKPTAGVVTSKVYKGSDDETLDDVPIILDRADEHLDEQPAIAALPKSYNFAGKLVFGGIVFFSVWLVLSLIYAIFLFTQTDVSIDPDSNLKNISLTPKTPESKDHVNEASLTQEISEPKDHVNEASLTQEISEPKVLQLETCKMEQKNGARTIGHYDGTCLDGLRHGYGTFTWVSGDVYVGTWDNDKQSGYGDFTNSRGDNYKGKFVDNMRDGHGEMKWASGARYMGAYERGRFQGDGVFIDDKGARFEGKFKNGVPTEEGTCHPVGGESHPGACKY